MITRMTWTHPLAPRHLPAAIALAVGVLISHPAMAQTAEPDAAHVIRLSPEQIAKVRDSAGTANAAADLSGTAVDRQIHGEVGMMVGTNGARGAYGTAAIPLGQNAGAVISFEDSRYGRR